MRRQKLSGYQPNYPRKVVKGAALAAAAMLALGTSAGCKLNTAVAGFAPDPQPTPGEELILDGETRIDLQDMGYIATEPPQPDEFPRTEGIVPLEPTEDPEEVTLMGDVAVFEP
ncbi:MAG: hypothetical protein II117_05355 [Clostridia bacterium]|nr:hypothetical protein [Clostridia bacterium]